MNNGQLVNKKIIYIDHTDSEICLGRRQVILEINFAFSRVTRKAATSEQMQYETIGPKKRHKKTTYVDRRIPIHLHY